jgi:hypothetical protein
MESTCIRKMCKKELTTLESDKEYRDIKKQIETIGREMVTISVKDQLTKQDAKRVKILYKQMLQTIKNKNTLEGLNKVRMCSVEKCKKDIDNMLQIFINDCNTNNKSKTCKLIGKKSIDSKQVQGIIDANFIELFSDLKNRVLNNVK